MNKFPLGISVWRHKGYSALNKKGWNVWHRSFASMQRPEGVYFKYGNEYSGYINGGRIIRGALSLFFDLIQYFATQSYCI
jgi:hypothetical protein